MSAQRGEGGVVRRVGGHRAVPEQAVERDQGRVRGDRVRSRLDRDEARRLGERDPAMLDRFAVLVRRHEVDRQPQVVHEDRLVLEAVGLLAKDAEVPPGRAVAARSRRDAGLLPCFLDDRARDRRTRRDAAADQVVEQARVDGLGRRCGAPATS